MAANQGLHAAQPNPKIYERLLTKESKSQQILIHSILWENLSSVFKQECQEAYHYFSMQSQNSTCFFWSNT